MRKTRWGLLLVALLVASLGAAEPARGAPGIHFVESFDAVQWWEHWDRDAPPQGTQRWSGVADGNHLRVWFEPAKHTGGSYLYGPRCTGDAKATTGQRVPWPGVRFTNGVWYEVEQVLTMNTPNRHDGSLLVRIDGRTVLAENDLCLRTAPAVPVGNAWMHFFHGGRLPSLSLTWIDLDDVVVDY